MSGTEAPIIVGQMWEQRVVVPGEKKPRVRVIEITGKPTLSTPVNYRIVRNDAHPHRVGKHASIRRGDLRAKYRTVTS